jgi:hypothetical protein
MTSIRGVAEKSPPHRLAGMPMQVVVPSVSRAAVLHGRAGTIIVEVPSADGLARPVDELAGCSATSSTVTGAAAGDD